MDARTLSQQVALIDNRDDLKLIEDAVRFAHDNMSRKATLAFSVGDTVQFSLKGGKPIVQGRVAKINQKTVRVDNCKAVSRDLGGGVKIEWGGKPVGSIWNVSASMLTKV